MSKGTERERQALEIYERAGYDVYSPQNPMYGDNDLWGLFDLACFRPTTATLRFVQVKSNRAQGIEQWSREALPFNSLTDVQTDFVVPYDYKGWRLIQPVTEGHETVYDERDEWDGDMGDGLELFLALGDGGYGDASV